MNPGDVLNDYSLEITARDVDRLGATGGYLTRGTPISIAFLPHDDVDELANVAAAVRRLGFIPVPHIAARRIKSTHELVRFLTKLREPASLSLPVIFPRHLVHLMTRSRLFDRDFSTAMASTT